MELQKLLNQCASESVSFALNHPELKNQFNGKFVIAILSYLNTCPLLIERIHVVVAAGYAVDLALTYFEEKNK